MTQTARTKVTNFTRTWKVDLYGSWGEGPSASLCIGSHIITLTADRHDDLTAIIDGENQASIDRAVRYLIWGREAGSHLEVLREGPTEPPTAPVSIMLAVPRIGKGRAHTLHKIMGTAGLPRAQHYSLAAAALGEPWPLETLSDLTEQEAGTVWAHLCSVYPSAREIAERVRAKAAPAQAQAA
ncbi:hypothetical protein [Deinococcus humi]|uniref:Uncharacterized protein n=1 Tax=Deinococcus humi TaxID=662880 RepID=A0A7W8JWX0_9DEIO|nr:hypothetical protein [Deinococcus humi]MBB5364495.1 hypothetical protein [Deinococcus humi]GGO32911.1 hypothetical protein GCM10008949_31260 [Deinococcus humi]